MCTVKVVVLSLAGCMATKVPTEQAEHLLQVRIVDGQLTEVRVLASGYLGDSPYAHSVGSGSLEIERLSDDGEVVWTGRWQAEPFGVDERFPANGQVEGTLVENRDQLLTIAVPSAFEDEVLHLRLVLSWPNEPRRVLEAALALASNVRARSSYLQASSLHQKAVNGRVEALQMCGTPDQNPTTCAEHECCLGVECIVDSCFQKPGSKWSGRIKPIAGAGPNVILLVPLGWEDPGAFEARAQEQLANLWQTSWWRENWGSFRFALLEADCFNGENPETTDRALQLLAALPGNTCRLSSPYRIVGLMNAGSGGRAEAPGPYSVVGIGAAQGTFAHELGHSVGGLGDEYTATQEYCDALEDVVYPNASAHSVPPWVCKYGGQACPDGGVVAAYGNSLCGSRARACPLSVMFSTGLSTEYGPVGDAAMDHALATGSVLQIPDCDCSPECWYIAEGSCGLSTCHSLCDFCPDGTLCDGDSQCQQFCPSGYYCRDVFGEFFCEGEEYVILVDGAAPRYRTCGRPTDDECLGLGDNHCHLVGCARYACGPEGRRCRLEGTPEAAACP